MSTRTKGAARRRKGFAAGVGQALRRAAKDAQKIARMYGTPLYVWEEGKVVALKPALHAPAREAIATFRGRGRGGAVDRLLADRRGERRGRIKPA